MSDAYLRTGRGGAGNFYSQKDVEDAATKDRTEDIEAQKPPTTQLPLDDNGTAPSRGTCAGGYMRSGRGGAGNFAASSPSTPSTTTIASFPPTSTATKYSGRGGAGNWAGANATESEGARNAREEQDRRRKEALDAGIAQEIRASLPQPPRTYHLHAPGRGRKREPE